MEEIVFVAILLGKMVWSYCAVGCTNRYGLPGIRFFSFPCDEIQCQKWIAAIRREKWSPTKNSKLCSAHFITGKLYHVNGLFFESYFTIR